MIDYWKLTKDFKAGDSVQRYTPGSGGSLSPYFGRVTATLPGIGFVDVQWPFGNERVSAEELVQVNPEFRTYLPPTLDFSWYPGLDAKPKTASKVPWRHAVELPPGFHKELARLYHRGFGEIRAYDELWHRFASVSSDTALRGETSKFYVFARNAGKLYFNEVARKTATYWMAQNRQHRATRGEIEACRPNCPRCGNPMRKTVYKMSEGQKMQLFACPQDLFIIKRDDIFGPGGLPVDW